MSGQIERVLGMTRSRCVLGSSERTGQESGRVTKDDGRDWMEKQLGASG